MIQSLPQIFFFWKGVTAVWWWDLFIMKQLRYFAGSTISRQNYSNKVTKLPPYLDIITVTCTHLLAIAYFLLKKQYSQCIMSLHIAITLFTCTPRNQKLRQAPSMLAVAPGESNQKHIQWTIGSSYIIRIFHVNRQNYHKVALFTRRWIYMMI